MRFSETFDFRVKPLMLPLFKHVANFESAKLGRFGPTFYDRTWFSAFYLGLKIFRGL